jgi:2-polyprenyl-6-methoxyphenol hydroxylase-like FAD-dependent oxidoreductase
MTGSVLISGAGVAGPALAFWLSRFGFRATVVERSDDLRAGHGGHAVDLFGPAIEIVERMGLLDAVVDARTRIERLSLIRSGRRCVEVNAEALSAGVSDRHVEILRGELVEILHSATRDDVEYVFGDEVASLEDTGDVVNVGFVHGGQRIFDLVIGADGLHSGIRRLVFGDEATFRTYLGGYLGVFTLGNYLGLSGRMLAYNAVDRAVGVYPVRPDRLRAVFLLRSQHELAYDSREPETQRQILREAFSGMGWEVPRLLTELNSADDLYVDSISQIRMETWSRGRVTLVGDAGYCPGPAVGGGTSVAMVAAYVLASELAASRGDHAVAFPAYERALADVVRNSRRVGPSVLATLIPRSRTQVWVMAQALRWLSRLPRPVQRRLTSFGGGPAAMLKGVTLRDPAALGTSSR